MTTTTERPSIFGLPTDEWREAYADAAARAMEAAHEAAVAYKAKNKPDPHAANYVAWRATGMVCVLVVKHRNAAASFEVSRDGSAYPHVYLPISKTHPLPESEGEFMLALLPRSFIRWLESKDHSAGQRLRELCGITLPLSPARPWTEEQCATWQRLGNRRMSIITRIQNAKGRSISNISRTHAA